MTGVQWTWALGLGLAAAVAALTGTWPYVLVAVTGVAYVFWAFRYPRMALLAWVLLAPAATVYGRIDIPGGIPDITFTRVTIAVIVVGLLLRTRLTGRALPPIDGPTLAMAAMLFVAGTDLIVRAGDLPSETLQLFDERIAPCLLFLLARNLLGGRRDVRAVAWAIVLSSCVLAAHGAYQVVRGPGIGITDAPESLTVREGGQRVQESHLEGGRAVGPFVNAVEFGSVAAIGLGAALYLTLHGMSGWLKAVPAAMVWPIGLAVILSLTRSVWIAAYAALWGMAALDRTRRAVLASGAIALTAVVLVLYLASDATSAWRERAESTEPVSGRLVMYQVALELAVERPIAGYGSGAPSRQAARRKLLARGGADAEFAPGQFHNVFLMSLVELGIGGLLAWTLVLVTFIRGGFALRRRSAEPGGDPAHFATMFLFATVVFLTQGLLVDTPAFLYLNGLYFLLAGVVYGQLDASSGVNGSPSPVALIARET